MRAPAVRPELGPSLPTLLAPLPRAVRLGLAGLVALVVLLVLWSALRPEPGVTRAVVTQGGVPFNLATPAVFERVAPGRGEVLRLASADPVSSVAVRPVDLGSYRGDPIAALMVRAGERARALRTLPGFLLRGEGRTRVNEQPGYQLLFQHRGTDGRLVYGRSVLLVPAEDDDPQPRRGAEIDLRTQRSAAVPNLAAVGANGPLKTVLRSFRFGTDAP